MTESEIAEKKRQLKELQERMKQQKANAPLPEFHDIPLTIIETLEARPALAFLAEIYKKNYKIVNYIFVCGVIGTIINYIVYHSMMNMFWEPIAFYMGIGAGAISNYSLTVGPFGYMFMLSEKESI